MWNLKQIEDLMASDKLTIPEQIEGFKRKFYYGGDKNATASFETDVGKREFRARITTNTIDRDGEIINPEGIDTSSYCRTGTVLWNHNYSEPAIGRVISIWPLIEIGGGTTGQVAHVRMAVGIPTADEIFALIQQRVLSAMSIGFVPIRGRKPTTKERNELPDLKYIHEQIALLEISVVNVPANPEALINEVSKGITHMSEPLQKDIFGKVLFKGY